MSKSHQTSTSATLVKHQLPELLVQVSVTTIKFFCTEYFVLFQVHHKAITNMRDSCQERHFKCRPTTVCAKAQPSLGNQNMNIK